MKKLFLILMAVGLCACTKENTVKVAGPVTLKAVIEDEEVTKTSAGTKNSSGTIPILWSEEDCISVFEVSSVPTNNKFEFTSRNDVMSAEFSGKCVPSDRGYYGIYPYNDKNQFICYSNDTYCPFVFWNGGEQVAHKGSWDPSKAVMLACSESDGENVALKFKNACSYVKFTTDYKCKSVTFEPINSDDVIACQEFRASYDAVTSSFTIDTRVGEVNKITLVPGEAGVIEQGTYYIALLPCVLNDGFKITFQSLNDDTRYYTIKAEKSVTFERGHVLNLGTMKIESVVTEFAGSGIESDPYLISDLSELKLLAQRVNNGEQPYLNPYYLQTADIDAHRDTLTPIGNVDHMFAGKYDGGNHTIKNAVYGHFESDGRSASGLFGNVYNVSIKNLKVENCTVRNYGASKNPEVIFGLIAAHAYSSDGYSCTITNCSASGALTYDAQSKNKGAYQVGGILGASNANITISNCINNVTFDNFYLTCLPDASMGGILGYAGPVKHVPSNYPDSDALVTIDRCRNNGRLTCQVHDDVSLTNVSVGGIVGRSYDAWTHETAVQISNCVNTGMVGQTNDNESTTSIGGIIGKNDSDGSSSMRPSIFNCLNTGTIRSASRDGYAGGIVGYNYDNTTVTMCVHAGHFNISYNIYKGCISGKYSGTYKHIFNTDTDTITLLADRSDSNFTDGSGYYNDLTVSTLNGYLSSNYSGYGAASWKYVDPASENYTLDLDF